MNEQQIGDIWTLFKEYVDKTCHSFSDMVDIGFGTLIPHEAIS